MFGLEILDIILGLAFVYLLLSLICSAVNEYLASMLNKRGRVLMDGLMTMLKDTGIDSRFFDHPLISTHFPHHWKLIRRARAIDSLPTGSRWIYRFFTWAFYPSVRRERYPSYLTARSFATAFLDISESLGAFAPGTDGGEGEATRAPATTGGTPETTSAPSDPVAPEGGAESREGTPGAGSTAAQGASDGGTGGKPAGTPDVPVTGRRSDQAVGTDAGPPAAWLRRLLQGLRRARASVEHRSDQVVGTDAGPPAAWLLRLLQGPRRAHDYATAASQAQGTLSGSTPTGAERALGSTQAADPKAIERLRELIDTLVREAALDIATYPNLALLSQVGSVALSDEVKKTLGEVALRERSRIQTVRDSVEMWFNNSMDRVSGAYKRNTQHTLFFIGLMVAFAVNADTIDLWRRLSTDDKLRDQLATQAAASVSRVAQFVARDTAPDNTGTSPNRTDSAANDTPRSAPESGEPPALSDAQRDSLAKAKAKEDSVARFKADSLAKLREDSLARAREQAKAMYDSATALLDRTALNLGWGWEDAEKLGFATKLDSIAADSLRSARVERDSTRSVARMEPTDSARRESIRALERRAKAKSDSANAAFAKADSANARRLKTAARADSTRAAGLRAAAKADSANAGTEARQRVPRAVFVYEGLRHPHWSSVFAKLLGLLLTTFALSLGAPFWFDMLNKVVNIRAAGRAPATTPAPTPAEGAKTDGKP